jgi:hypothetical protein
MAVENIGEIFPTKIPGLEETADIQEALRLYHYGSTSYDPDNTDKELLPNPSMAYNLKVLEADIDALQSNGIGSEFVGTQPTDVPDGFIWVDAASEGPVETTIPTVFYQNDAPTTGLVEGRLWVDKNSNPLTMYVYDSVLGWREIGSYSEES